MRVSKDLFCALPALLASAKIAAGAYSSDGSIAMPPHTSVSASSPAAITYGPQILEANRLELEAFYWTQAYHTTVIGTVVVQIDVAQNLTTTRTLYHTDYDVNGTRTPILRRSDIDAAGTVTATAQGAYHSSTTILTYPTPWVVYDSVLYFTGVTATTYRNNAGSCCFYTSFSSPTPTHSPFPLPSYIAERGGTDTSDPTGWMYTLTTAQSLSADPSDLYGYDIGYTAPACQFTRCAYSTSIDSPEGSDTRTVGVFARSTAYLDLSSSSTPRPASSTSPQALSEIETSSTPRADTSIPTSTRSDETPSSSSFTSSPPAVPQTTETSPPSSSTPVSQPQQPSSISPSVSSSPVSPPATSTPAASSSSIASSSPVNLGSSSTSASPTVVVGSTTATPQSNSAPTIGSQSSSTDSTITVGSASSTTIPVLASNSNSVVIPGPFSSAVPPSTSSASIATPLPAVTLGNSIITANSASAYVIGSQTLLPGSNIVISGSTISLASHASRIIIASQTLGLESTSSQGGVGGYIWSGLNVGSTSGTFSGASTTAYGSNSTGPSRSSTLSIETQTRNGSGQLGLSIWLGCLCVGLFLPIIM